MKFSLKALFLLLFILSYTNLKAQTKVTIHGVVKDSISSKVLNLATVRIYQSTQITNPLKVIYTDSAGTFSFIGTDTTSYVIDVSHIGYLGRSITTTNDYYKTAQIILLAPSKNTLQEITVVAKKPLIEQKDDKIIYNAANDPDAKAETATDILRRVPFVTVDGDGNVLVNGQSNFKVLLNGKETALFSRNVKDALKSFPGVVISKIEVITSPSSKYDAEGTGGIINIITTKKVKGVNGFASFFTRTPNNSWQSVENINAKFGKVGFVLNLTQGGFENRAKTLQEIIPVETASLINRVSLGNSLTKGNLYSGTSELNYEIDSLSAISVFGSFDNRDIKTEATQLIVAQFTGGSAAQSDFEVNTGFIGKSFNIGTDFINKFKKESDKEFSVRLNMESGNNETDPVSSQIDKATGKGRFIMNKSYADNKEYTLQSDYIHPFRNNEKFETGVKFIFRKAFSDFGSRVKFNSADEYITDLGNTNYFDYTQNVYGAYGIYNFKINKTGIRLGGRVEHTEVQGNFTSSATSIRQSYTNFFPNIQASFKITDLYSLIVAYNKRLQRPFITNLNPFVNNNDTLNVSFGNPDLGPQIFHTLSAQNRFSKGNTFVGLTLTGSFSNNAITSLSVFDRNTGVTKTTSANIGRQFLLTLNGNFSTKITTKWDLSFNGSVNYTDISNKLNLAIQNSGITGNATMSSRFNITKKLTLSAFTGFARSPIGIQTTFPFVYFYGSAINSKFFKEKLTARLQLFSFFNKEFDFTTRIKDPSFRITTTSTTPWRNVGIFFLWNFGKLKGEVSKKKGVVNDDLLKENKD